MQIQTKRENIPYQNSKGEEFVSLVDAYKTAEVLGVQIFSHWRPALVTADKNFQALELARRLQNTEVNGCPLLEILGSEHINSKWAYDRGIF